MAQTKKPPLRMCLACREMKSKKEMVRIVKNKDGAIFLDFSGKAAGRGAYICNKKECVEKLRKQRLIHKAFSSDVPMEVYDRIEEEFLAQS
ncbi:MAG: YlxR family protein [Clostridia bacterium]|nr:YlxR family protein [Clostridia bacterium]